jgi:hypothetical protein
MDVLFYLKEGLVKSRYDYYIYMAPGTQFRRKPRDPLEVLGESPLHVTLETKISGREEGRVWLGHPVALYYQRLREAGVQNPIYLSTAAFWIVHHEAIPTVFGLAYHFWALGKKAAPAYGLDAALSYAMQMLCGDPGEHTTGKTSALWAPIRGELGQAAVARDQHWQYAYPLSEDKTEVNPCLVSRIQ